MESSETPILNSLISSEVDFPLLERTIEVLVVDDDPDILRLLAEYLGCCRLYIVKTASCAQKAQAVFLSQKRIHVCIMDLGLSDINNDEYYLIKEFSSKTSFIVLTGRDSLDAGFKARCLGACAAIIKPVDVESPFIFNHINDAFLQSAFKKSPFNNCKPVIMGALETLISKKPAEMKSWIEMQNIDERYFRKVWVECFGYQPRYLLILFNAYVKAFEYYFNFCCKEPALDNGEDDALRNSFEHFKGQFKTVYQKHQKKIDAILAG